MSANSSESVSHRACIDRVDWPRVLPVLNLFKAPAMAFQPSKILVAYVMLLGVILWGAMINPLFATENASGPFWHFLGDTRQAVLAIGDAVFSGSWTAHPPSGGLSVLQAFRWLLIDTPVWLLDKHLGFAIVFGAGAAVWVMVGSMLLATMAGVGATRDEQASLMWAWRYAQKRLLRLTAAVLAPWGVMLVMGLMLVAAGFIFSIPVGDIAIGAGYGVVLLVGTIAAALLLAHLFSVHLLPMAVAVDDSDVFDAISRSVNYSCARPLRFLCYQIFNLLMLVLVGVVTSLIVDWALAVTEFAVSQGVVAKSESGVGKLDAILPEGAVLFDGEMPQVPEGFAGTTPLAGWLVLTWIKFLKLVPAAVVVSCYFAQQAWTYLLLRRQADGANFNETELPPIDQAVRS